MNYDTLLIYSIVSFFYIISPGPAILLSVYNGAVNGVYSVVASALGNIIGLMFLSTLSISGLSAILLTSSTLFFIVKFTGALYLIYLGFKQFYAMKTVKPVSIKPDSNISRNFVSFFKEGLFVASTNLKPIVFFAALFPQFISTESAIFPQFVIMTLIFMAFSFLSLFTYGYMAQKAKGFLSKTNNIKWFHRISDGLFIAMGASLFQFKSAS